MICNASIFEAETALTELKDAALVGALFNTGDTLFFSVESTGADADALAVPVDGVYPVDFSRFDPSSILFYLSVVELDTR